ncbi:long-chain fatty acid transport protein 4-like [Lutzomyia longipalpis]|uniref:long-chain-fatty-acid--CoA ligase n=1 Tax=Lutzomyia longipalpis TaxID=7200 RepID=A0A1B0GJK9_LUTLO|nr:long-chain fatty acid transport protein 4-like [Lutzomyia longipalpis]
MNNNNNQFKPSLEDAEKGHAAPPPATERNVARRGSAASEVGKQRAVYCRVAIIAVGFVCLVAIVTLLWYFMGWIWGLQALLVAALVAFAASGAWRWFYVAAVTAPRDVKALFRYIRLLWLVKKLQRRNATIADVFAEHVAKTPDKTCFIFEGREWTFREVEDFSNRIASVFHGHGYKGGDVVGLLLENRPEFVATWLGLSRLGIIVPLINHNLRQASLLHSITVAKCNALIFGESLIEAVEEILPTIPSSVSLYQFNDAVNGKCQATAKDLTSLMMSASKDAPKAQKPNHHDQLLYIYTSGTTGLPKAAVITHSRYIFICSAIHYLANFRSDDIFYTPLPLYHTAGGVMNAGQAILFGATVVIRKKFSASGYFPDCQKYKCTVAQYIGEMCRYVLATPPSSSDRAHNLRLVFGNGLRPQIWPQFVERFGIPRVAEFYGATEGNANIVNIDNTVGAIGFVSRIIPSVYPISIIRADPATGEPIRGRNGLCQLCKANEPGVFIGKILPGNPSRAFLGYVDKKASDKKIVKDVFKKGDSAFLSGDLLIADEWGNLFFKDRTGDTFRWKGENVSTSEVEAQVSNMAGYRDAVVYGVEIPNMEGRAGMAAILDPDRKVDLTALAEGLRKALPTYARPQFVRLLTKVDMTGTYKLKKLDLQNDGFNPENITDSLFYLTPKGHYEELTQDIYAKICSGEIRL